MLNQIIMIIMAFGAVLGGIDRIMGNRLGYGKRFEEGLGYLGPMALSMAGIICLAPLLSGTLGEIVIPVYKMMGVDPAMFGSILAIDMGGYQLSMGLAADPAMGRYAGIIVSAVLGCTLVFVIPVGMGMIEREDRTVFAKGVMLGFAAMPTVFLTGGLLCGMSMGEIIHQNLPVLMLCLLLAMGLFYIPDRMVRGFEIFAVLIKVVITVGLVLAAVSYMTGFSVLPGMVPIEEAMAVVSSIGIVLLGSLPVTELIQRLLKRPFTVLGRKIGLDSVSILGLLVSVVSVIPTFTMLKDMNRKGKLVNVAYMVSATSLLAAHLGFTASTEPDMLAALLVSKAVGSVTAVVLALLVSGKE